MMIVTVTVVLAAAVLVVLAVSMAWVLGWAFHVEVDPLVEAVVAALPGANCGGCGFVGCGEYAEAVVGGRAAVTLCAPGGTACAAELAQILGVEVDQTDPYRAVVHCAAGYGARLGRVPYEGEPTCAAANLVAGVQGCVFGCLGLSDCTRACDYDAIHTVDGLASGARRVPRPARATSSPWCLSRRSGCWWSPARTRTRAPTCKTFARSVASAVRAVPAGAS